MGVPEVEKKGENMGNRRRWWAMLVALCALAFVAFVLCDTLSIMYFLSRQGYRVPLRKVLFTSLAGQYYSNIIITDDDRIILNTANSGYELYRIPE